MKFCKDCQWYKPSSLRGTPFATCQSPLRPRSVVTGEYIELGCELARVRMYESDRRCGPDAQWFMPRSAKGEQNVPPHS